MNQVILIGQLGRDPEPQTSKNGKLYCKFSLAAKTPRDNAEPITTWINCVAFGKGAERVARAKKGQTLFVTGRIDVSTSEKDGRKIYYTTIVVDHVAGAMMLAVEKKVEQEVVPVVKQSSFEDDDIPY